MQEQYQQLTQLVKSVPELNTYKSSSELNLILTKYTDVLNYINGYNEAYKRATNIYYTSITSIRDNMQRSVTATTAEEKNLAFNVAKSELRSDLEALATLINPQEESIEAPIQIMQHFSSTPTKTTILQ